MLKIYCLIVQHYQCEIYVQKSVFLISVFQNTDVVIFIVQSELVNDIFLLKANTLYPGRV
jgi:hypothetical protein